MEIILHRIYNDLAPKGYRVLVDRLWPRGISKEDASLDGHWKELAPSNALRKWFGHDLGRWAEFRQEYLHELNKNKRQIKERLAQIPGKLIITLRCER